MELDQARRQHHVQSLSLRNELQTARTEAGNPSQGGPQHELEESRVHRDRLQLELTQAMTQVTAMQGAVTQRDEQLAEHLTQNQLEHATHGETDGLLRAKLTSAQEQLTRMHTTRLTTVRDYNTSLRRVEETEASLREMQVLVTRERDGYYEELIQSLPTTVAAMTPVQAVPPPPPTPITVTQAVPQQIASTVPGGTLQQGMEPLPPPSQPPSTQPNPFLGAVNPGIGLSMGYGADPPTPAISAVVLPASVPNQYSIATPPVPQEMSGSMNRGPAANPLVDPLQLADPWDGQSLPFSASQGLPSIPPSSVPPGFSHVPSMTAQGYAFEGPTPVVNPAVASTSPVSHHPSQYQQPQQSHGPGDQSQGDFSKVKTQPAKLPRLELRAADSSKAVLLIDTWVQLCSTAINTWGVQAVKLWHNSVHHARREHASWTMLTPAQRTLNTGSFNPTFRPTPPLTTVEAYNKSELMTQKILPDEFVQFAE
eukprot:6492273-Amphidinium_carterae.2